MQFRFIITKISALLVLGSTLAYASADKAGNLAADLKHHYRLATAKLRVNGVVSIEPGTVLLVRKEGIVSFEQNDSSFATLCPTEYRDGELHAAQSLSCTSLTPGGRRLLKLSEPVCVTAIDVSELHDTVTLFLATCALSRRSLQSETFRTMIVFRFPAGSVATASISRVEEVIGEVLSENGSKVESASQTKVEAPVTPGPVAADAAPAGSKATPEPKLAEPKPAEPKEDAQQPAEGAQSGPGHSEPCPDGSSATAKTPTEPAAGDDLPAPLPPAPAGVAKGQDPDQVKAILGPPSSIADLGSKVIYFYPNLKIVFMNGRVSQIEQI